ncbi:uncharacterized protein [Leptinotarsa decemlineata]|uniref:uncharacterized protein n=1 Tax=Leptinotarsa decemlineata TaxID=7539 RepID=UPI003D3051DE
MFKMDFGNVSPTRKEQQTYSNNKPFESICRICLGSGDLQPLQGLDVYNTFICLSNIFNNGVNCEDQLPQNICNPCVLELENIDSYIINLKNATQTLKEILLNEKDVENYEIIKKESLEDIKEQIILEFSNEDNSCIEVVLDEYSTEFNSKDIFICKVCNTGFATQKSLRTHNRMHVSNKNYDSLPKNYYNCHICEKNFTFERSWKYHMSTHPEVTLWECSLCEWASLDESLLKEHEQDIHLKESNIDFTCIDDEFLCNICGESFAEMGSMKDHLKIHTKVKYRKCNVCGLTFIHSNTLLRHMKVHSQEERFDCNFCAKSFTKKTFSAHTYCCIPWTPWRTKPRRE